MTKSNHDISPITRYPNHYLIYTRRSTDDTENQKNSIEYQEQEIARMAAREGLLIAPVTIPGLCENGIIREHHSAFKQSNIFEVLQGGAVRLKVERPKFLHMVDLLQKRLFKGIICMCWDRISRNKLDEDIIDKLIRQGVDILFVQAKYENSIAGELQRDVEGVFSRQYSRTISEKVRSANAKLRREGKCIYFTPIGYLDKGSDFKPVDQNRAPLVKRIFELYATGEWSYQTLAAWANIHGLTTKPTRRKRTQEERLNGVPLETIPKISRPITAKTIEHILSNPFYIGKMLHKGDWIDSKVHQPLIDIDLFIKVRQVQKLKTKSIHYPDLSFATYRGIFKCSDCGRTYSPYVQKGYTYYRLKCHARCKNKRVNISEKFITDGVLKILQKIYFSEQELHEITENSKQQLSIISDKRNADLQDLYHRMDKAMADMDFLMKERLTLLRTNAMTLEGILTEEARLHEELRDIQMRIQNHSETAQNMLSEIITFSELVKGVAAYYKSGFNSDRRNIVVHIFSELYLLDGEIKYVAKPSFKSLLKRFVSPFETSGDPNYLFSEMVNIYNSVKIALPNLEKILKNTTINKL